MSSLRRPCDEEMPAFIVTLVSLGFVLGTLATWAVMR